MPCNLLLWTCFQIDLCKFKRQGRAELIMHTNSFVTFGKILNPEEISYDSMLILP